MGLSETLSAVRRDAEDSLGPRAVRLGEVMFGDRVGLLVFCASLALSVLTWRIGTFFNDIELFVMMLDRLAEGHLSLGRVGELDRLAPGMYRSDGRVYGRAHGFVVLSLPFLWLFEAVDAVTDPRWVIVLGWSGLLVAIGWLAGDLLDRPVRGRRLGAVIGGLAVAINAPFHKPIVHEPEIIALQTTTILAGAFTGVFVYRTLARKHGQTVGAIGGLATVLATPVAVWATVAKRHAVVTVFVVVVVYAVARSRSESDAQPLGSAGFRAVAYAATGLLAWVYSPEGFTLFLALLVVDPLTAPSNDRRTLAIVGGAFALSLVPFLVTNQLVSGHPLEPPRFLTTYRGEVDVGSTPTGDPAASPGVDGGGDGGGASGAGGGAGGESGGSMLEQLVPEGGLLPPTVVSLFQRASRMYLDGLVVLFTAPERMLDVFVRWGRHGYDPSNIFFDDGTNLSVLESAPIAAALAAAALPLRSRIGELRARSRRLRDLLAPIDALVLVFAVLLVALYINQLPIRVQLTVRYLHPLYPLAVLGVLRLEPVRAALLEHLRAVGYGFEATALLVTPIAVGAMLRLDVSKGEVVQAHGLVALAVGAVLAGALLVSAVDDRAKPLAAGAFGVAAGLGTVFVLLTAFVLIHFGPSMLPFVETASGELRFAILT